MKLQKFSNFHSCQRISNFQINLVMSCSYSHNTVNLEILLFQMVIQFCFWLSRFHKFDIFHKIIIIILIIWQLEYFYIKILNFFWEQYCRNKNITTDVLKCIVDKPWSKVKGTRTKFLVNVAPASQHFKWIRSNFQLHSKTPIPSVTYWAVTTGWLDSDSVVTVVNC